MSETTKTVIVKYLLTGQDIDIDIGQNDTVGMLKSKIENLLNIEFVKPPKLMIKKSDKRTNRILADMNQTIKDARIKTYDNIIISKTDVVGGQ
jgi:hypothetical protein